MTEDEIIEALRGRVATGRPTDSVYVPELLVASQADLDEVEAGLGFPLPPLLRRIYLEVANGGVGPSVGIEGLPPDGHVSDGGNMVTACREIQAVSARWRRRTRRASVRELPWLTRRSTRSLAGGWTLSRVTAMR